MEISKQPTLASHLAEQDGCAYKILQDGQFGKIEQEYLEGTCKINQDLCLAKMNKTSWPRLTKIMISDDQELS